MIKKKEAIILVIIIICCGAAIIVMNYLKKETGNIVKIEYQGEVLYEANLNKDNEYVIGNKDSADYNIVKISDGKVCVIEADCRDQICVKKGYICNVGESIICLPHKLVITVLSKN